MKTTTDNTLQHLGIVMDGNRRWAKAHHVPAFFGHRRGVQTLKKVGVWCLDRGIKFLTVWAFSTENWSRPRQEVKFLMRLAKEFAYREVDFLKSKGIQLRILGRIKELPKDTQEALAFAVRETKQNTKAIMNIALNYGGKGEVIDGIKQLIKEKINPEKITEELFGRYLYAPAIPDPDLIIRTGGQERTSGFLLWESTYAEWYFTQKKWPEFNEGELDKAIADYRQRQRNFGK